MCAPQEEDAPTRSTSTEVNGYRAGLTPGNLAEFLAKGQQSTDPTAPEEQSLSEFGCRSPSRRPARETRDDVVSVATKDPCRGWGVIITLSPRFRVPQVREGEKMPRGACPFSPGRAWPVKGWARRRRRLPPSSERRGRGPTGRTGRRFVRGVSTPG